MADSVPPGFWTLPTTFAFNKFFDPSPPSMRKVDDIGKKTGKGGGEI